jgi:hypothetical protein
MIRFKTLNADGKEIQYEYKDAKEAGEYVDKHFGVDQQRCSYSTVKIVEV